MEEFDSYGEIELSPRYNIAPSQPVVTIRQDVREPVRRLSMMRWGLVPSWAKDPSIGYKTINARSETVPMWTPTGPGPSCSPLDGLQPDLPSIPLVISGRYLTS
jgi:hypothetical protein